MLLFLFIVIKRSQYWRSNFVVIILDRDRQSEMVNAFSMSMIFKRNQVNYHVIFCQHHPIQSNWLIKEKPKLVDRKVATVWIVNIGRNISSGCPCPAAELSYLCQKMRRSASYLFSPIRLSNVCKKSAYSQSVAHHWSQPSVLLKSDRYLIIYASNTEKCSVSRETIYSDYF